MSEDERRADQVVESLRALGEVTSVSYSPDDLDKGFAAVLASTEEASYVDNEAEHEQWRDTYVVNDGSGSYGPEDGA